MPMVLSPQAILTSPMEVTALEVRLHGGVMTEDFDESVTHVVCDTRWVLVELLFNFCIMHLSQPVCVCVCVCVYYTTLKLMILVYQLS